MELSTAIDLIRKIINVEVDFKKEDFIEFEKIEDGMVYAIDGSSVKIFDGGSFIISARRVGYVVADEKNIVEERVGEIEVDVIYGEDAENENERRRECEERELAKKLARGGKIVMVDGCIETDENVVGISKKSGLKRGFVPLLFLIKKYGDKLMPDRRWYYKISEGIYAVKFHPYARFVFRVDYHGEKEEEIFGKISSFCNDVGCLGYPYPLAEIHRRVTIGKDEVDYLRIKLQEEALKSGMGVEEWENIFYDYHEYLE